MSALTELFHQVRRAFDRQRRAQRLEEQAKAALSEKARRKGRPGMPPLEVRRKVRALVRHEEAAKDMFDRARYACCPSCLFGDRYDDALTKAERIRAELGLPLD